MHTLPDSTIIWRPMEFRSKSFSTLERSWAAHARELLTFIGGLKYFRPFLLGVPFSVITDSSALAWLKTSRDQSPCLQRWLAYVSSFVFKIQHRPGKRIVTEDALSRRPDMEFTVDQDDMLSLPDPDDYGLPEPSGGAPPNSLVVPPVAPSFERPPMDHDGVRLQLGRPTDTHPVYMPRPALLEHEAITCATLEVDRALQDSQDTPRATHRQQRDGHVLAWQAHGHTTGWRRHCGTRLDRVTAFDLAEFCVGHELQLTLPADYYTPDHPTHPFNGPRAVRVYDTFTDRTTPLQVAVYLLDLPLDNDPGRLEFETGMIVVSTPVLDVPAHGPGSATVNPLGWTLMRALQTSFPHAKLLKDLLPDADSTVVFQHTLMPIYKVMASQSVRGGGRGNDLLIQFAEGDLDGVGGRAWIHDRFVPMRYQDEFWEDVERDDPPDSGN